MKISKKFQIVWDLKGKIWPNSNTEDNVNEALLTWSVSPPENQMMKIKYFFGAIQSYNTVFAGFSKVQFWQRLFYWFIYVNYIKDTLVWFFKLIFKKHF